MGNGWSIAWRVHDAQFWGVPQRRKRISLVADFGGQTAPEILFERKGVSGDIKKGEQAGEEAPRAIRESVDTTSYTLKIRGGVEIDSKGKKAGKGALVQTELSGTLGVSQDQTLITTIYSLGHDVRSAKFTNDEITDPLTATDYKDPIKISVSYGGDDNTVGALCARDYKGVGSQYAEEGKVIVQSYGG